MAYSAQQLRNLRLAQTIGRQAGATRAEQKAAIEAMLVESHARNLSYGDRDSVGILQQRPSQGWAHATDPAGALRDFYAHARQYRGQGLSSGALAQAVQRSAYPDRYAQHSGEAQALLHGQAGAGYAPAAMAPQAPSVDPAARQALLLDYVAHRGDSDALLTLAAGLRNLPQSAPAASYQTTGSGTVGGYHVAKFDGKPVLAKFIPELQWARANGWDGQVTSGERTRSQQMSAARNYGLQHYGPAGPLGSNHVKGHAGAVDVTRPGKLNAVLARYPGKRLLVWGGPVIGDNVHFSPTGH